MFRPAGWSRFRAGGHRGLYPYRTGEFSRLLQGHLVTSGARFRRSVVTVVLTTAQRFGARSWGEPQLDMAVLKIDGEGPGRISILDEGGPAARWHSRPGYSKHMFKVATGGTKQVSVLHGVIAARTGETSGRRGNLQTNPDKARCMSSMPSTNNPVAVAAWLTRGRPEVSAGEDRQRSCAIRRRIRWIQLRPFDRELKNGDRRGEFITGKRSCPVETAREE